MSVSRQCREMPWSVRCAAGGLLLLLLLSVLLLLLLSCCITQCAVYELVHFLAESLFDAPRIRAIDVVVVELQSRCDRMFDVVNVTFVHHCVAQCFLKRIVSHCCCFVRRGVRSKPTNSATKCGSSAVQLQSGNLIIHSNVYRANCSQKGRRHEQSGSGAIASRRFVLISRQSKAKRSAAGTRVRHVHARRLCSCAVSNMKQRWWRLCCSRFFASSG